MARAALIIVLALALAAISAQGAAGQIAKPDGTTVTWSSTDAAWIYSVFGLACNTATYTSQTATSSSHVNGGWTFSNSPSGCTSNVGVTCVVTPAGNTVTVAFTTKTGTGGTATITTGGAFAINCGSGFCIVTIAAQGPKSGLTYTNATGVLNVNTTLSATRSGAGGALCGPASGSGTLKGTFTASPKITIN